MPFSNQSFPASSGFDSFSIPIKSSFQSEQTANQAPDLPQTTTVTWSSSKKSLPIDKSGIHPSDHSDYTSGHLHSQNVPTEPAGIVMSKVAGPQAISANALRSYPSASVHSSLPVLTAMSGVANPENTTMNAPSSGWNMTGNTSTPASSNYQFPYSASNQLAENNNSTFATPSTNSSSSAYQYQPHHQHSNSLGNASNMELNSNNSFTGHRRVNTESAMPSAQYLSGYAGNFMGNTTDQSGPQAAITAATPTSKPVSLGPLRVHQFFPTTGEAGVPVTVLATVKAEWARQVGLQLTSGIYGGNDTQAARTHGGCRFTLCFGTTEVETRSERSIGMGDSPFNTMAALEGTSYLSHNANAKDVDLTIIAHAPHYPGPQLQNPSQGGRVQVRIKVVGAPLDPSLRQLIDGLDVGEFCYWQVSPRTNLKRPGDDLLAEQHGLRRPASFPALGSQFGQSGSGEDAKFVQPQINATFPRSQTVGRMNEMTSPSSSTIRRPGMPEFPGFARMASANDIRSIDSMSTISTQTLPQGMQSAGQQYGTGFTPGSQQYSNWGAPSASPSSSLRRNSMGFSSSGLGPGSDMSRPSSELPSYPLKSHDGSYQGSVTPMPESGHQTPQLIRSTQLNPTSPPTNTLSQPSNFKHSYNASVSTNSSSSPPTDRSGLPIAGSQRASLELHGNIQDMAVGWSHDEWRSRRRLIQFWRKQEGTTIHAICKPILPEEYIPNSVVVSCIFWDVTNECYITSVDVIYLLEALVASRFNVEEKNRIRRNLEGLKPKTISKIAKSGDDKLNKIHEEFFKLVMSFPNPKPRHIEKDIKIFPWRVLASALNKIISKYSAAPLMAAANMQYASAMGMQAPPSGMQMQTPSMIGMDAGQLGYGAQQNQQDHQRRFPSGLSIDVDVSNASYAPSSAPPAANHGQQSSQGQGSLLFPPHSATFGRGMNTPGVLGSGGMQSYYSQNSPRKPSLSGGLPGSSTFNFSDFVVSPVAFGQTPLQQAQSLGHYPSSTNQQPQDQHQGGQSSGLGMDLGNVYKPES